MSGFYLISFFVNCFYKGFFVFLFFFLIFVAVFCFRCFAFAYFVGIINVFRILLLGQLVQVAELL